MSNEVQAPEARFEVADPIAVAAKQSLLRLIIPTDSELYCLVLDHDDFGIHNMLITWMQTVYPLLRPWVHRPSCLI